MWSERRGTPAPRPLIRRGASPTLAIALTAFLTFLTAAQAVLAEDCIPQVAAFPPGAWVASGIGITYEDVDDLSVLVGTETGGFGIEVDQGGGVTGTFSMAGEGGSEWRNGDEGYSESTWLKTGRITGTSSHLQVDGEIDIEIEGGIDISPSHSDDPITKGDDVVEYENQIVQPFSLQFSPSAANCNQVLGSLDGPVQYDTAAPQSIFLAVRTGARAGAVDVQGQLAGLLEEAQLVLNMDPVDTDVLLQFVFDMLAFESLLASLESCDPGDELDMGAAWLMLQSVMFNTMHHFLNAADSGAYTTQHVITVAGIWLQGGSLGWRNGDCISPGDANEGALDLLLKFEDVLLERLETAGETERSQIAAAAYQYGLPRVIAALEGN